MIVNVKDKAKLLKVLSESDFSKTSSTIGVPAVTYKKDDISISYVHGRFHTDEKGTDYIKSLNLLAE